MKYVITHGDDEHALEVHEHELGGFDVMIDGRTVHADLAETGDEGIYSLLVDGRSCELLIVDDPENTTVIHHGMGCDLRVESERERNARAIAGDAVGGTGSETVKAVMPGIVVSVAVAEGDVIAAGDGVCVLEAMKMENEIRASGGGRVVKVHVAAGDTVNGGDALVEIEAVEE